MENISLPSNLEICPPSPQVRPNFKNGDVKWKGEPFSYPYKICVSHIMSTKYSYIFWHSNWTSEEYKYPSRTRTFCRVIFLKRNTRLNICSVDVCANDSLETSKIYVHIFYLVELLNRYIGWFIQDRVTQRRSIIKELLREWFFSNGKWKHY